MTTLTTTQRLAALFASVVTCAMLVTSVVSLSALSHPAGTSMQLVQAATPVLR